MSSEGDKAKRDSLVQKREKYFARITALHNAGKRYQSTISKGQPAESELQSFISRYERLESDYATFDELSDQLSELNLKLDQSDRMNVEQSVTACENLYFSIQTMARMWNVRGNEIVPPAPVETQPAPPHVPKPRLPKIEIPIFDGSDIKQWPNFYELFISLIDRNETISKVEKLTHLKTLLRSHALSLIESLPITARNYDIALQTLVSRFQNTRLLGAHFVDLIFNFKPLQEETLSGLIKFLDIFNTNLNALKTLDIEDLFDFVMLCAGLKVLPNSTRREFENEHANVSVPSFKDLIAFVNQHVRILEMSSEKPASKHVKISQKFSKSMNSNSRSAFVSSVKTNYAVCPKCKSNTHRLYACIKFKEMSVSARQDFVRKNSLCFACLGFHLRKNCKSTGKCSHCQNVNHHSLLHSHSRSNSLGRSENASTSEQNVDNPQSLSCSVERNETQRKVLLSTAVIGIRDRSGIVRPVRAIVDNGSQISLITDACAQRLNLSRNNSSIGIIAVANASVSRNRGVVSCSISPLNDHNKVCTTHALVLNDISVPQPSFELDPQVRQRFANIKLADPAFDKKSKIEFLIGADLYYEILNESYNVIKGQPSAISTIFGWIIGGPIPSTDNNVTPASTFLTCCESLDTSLKKFWETEEIEVQKPLDPDDTYCENQFANSHFRTEQGRYVVSLPFREKNVLLPDTRAYAKKCLLKLETRLKCQPHIYVEYKRFMNEYISLGHMSITHNPARYILPHHCVLKETSSTTKVRPVFNASFRGFPSSISLNDILLSGPKLQKDICDVISNFRLHAFVVCCDLQQMYRQVLVSQEDRFCQHIFYRPIENGEIMEYELNTLTFGVKPSAFLAQRVLIQLVQDEGHQFPLASEAITHQTFVDDICTSVDTVQEALQLQRQLIDLLKLGGFTLRKWASNCQMVLDTVPLEHREHALVIRPENDHSVKVLGLQYDPAEDKFSYQLHLRSIVQTKRSLLSEVARIYDPLGWLSPLTFKAKCLIQQTWLTGINWDDPLPQNIAKQWEKFYQSLGTLENLKIARFIPVTHATTIRLVGFSDASSLGYSAVIYIRLEIGDRVDTYLLKAKNKVAPLKTLSIPRLELCGAVLLAQLFKSLENVYKNVRFDSVHCFTDSMTVLAWLRTAPHKLKVFVANRIVRILEYTQPQWWNHVRTDMNPSDCSCRGMFADELKNCELWWRGPSFLFRPLSDWPLHDESPFLFTEIPEIKEKEIQSLLVEKETSPLIELMNRVSSLSKLQRIVAWLQRFCFNCRARRNEIAKNAEPLNPSELKSALQICIKIVQNVHYAHDMKCIAEGKALSSPLISLTPFLDENGFLRVGGRLKFSMLPYSAKHPLIVPKDSRLAVLICDYYHKITLHSGPRLTQALIQRRYWVIGIRNLLRQRIRQCVTCQRLNAANVNPQMADLPPIRFEEGHAFLNVGLDYAGPFTIKESSRRKSPRSKGYMVVFVCLSTKAIHLEFASSLSTSCFLAVLDRFVARRGLCRKILTDCGTSFKGASRHFHEIKRFLHDSNTEISDHLAQREIQWIFNPPSAPHFGGIFEAGVKSAKHHLTRIIGPLVLTYEEMCTILAKVESVLNSRPLGVVSNDPNDDIDYLTPGHFLVGRPLLAPPEVDKLNMPLNTLDRYELLQRTTQCFWKRWSNDYLHTLISRNKWTQPQENLQQDDVVYIKSENTTPLNWPIGRIQEVYPGRDGAIRVAKVKTANGTYVRPVHKLVPLPKVESANS